MVDIVYNDCQFILINPIYAGNDMTQSKSEDVRRSVRDAYAKVAQAYDAGACCGESNSCCGVPEHPVGVFSTRLGYSQDDVTSVPAGADMGLGCGNPGAIASLKSGDTVLDLGSGGGFDCFLAARQIGQTGHVIGVDMTPDMISKARRNAQTGDYRNVEFRLGEIEHLPVSESSVDVIISNCVINLSPDKSQVFREAFRVLKPEGRLAVSDVVALAELPDEITKDPTLYCSCIGGASVIENLEKMMVEAGFIEISITSKDESRAFISDWAPGQRVEDYVVSAYIQASKPSR